MKKILLLFSAVGLFSLTACDNDDNYGDGDTIAEVFEVANVDFNANDYSVVVSLDPQIYSSDMVLVYRLTDDPDTSLDVWELIPRTLYMSNGDEIDYDYNFTTEDVLLYMGAAGDLADYPEYTQNQVFRIVIIPGYGSNFRTSANALEQFKDYNAVIKKYGIKESSIKQLSVKQ
jgi:hypothetical protein